MTEPVGTLRRALAAPCDAASLHAFRVGFGLLAAAASARFVALGWVESLLLAPRFHFAWLPWVVMPTAPVLYGLFAAQAVAGVGIAAGRRPRLWLALWLLSFGYVELLDKSLYLNHYVLFSLLGLWLLVIPLPPGARQAPTWALWLLRAQVGTVYLWAGLAKLNSDWLLRAEPLSTWLQARMDLPMIGPLLAHDATAVVMSWGGAAYDLTIPLLLLWPRTRALGMALVIGFHLTVGALFPIGIFPALMILSATLLLSPSWPRRWLRRLPAPPAPAPATRQLRPAGTALWLVAVSVMALFPGRAALWGSDVSWTERGYRLSWRVMLNEKTGMVDYRVVEHGTGRTWRVMPSEELTMLQHKQMRTQPDMIRDYALHLHARFATQGHDVAVYADAWASLNGRPAQRLLRPDVDLTHPVAELEQAGWIVPLETPSAN